MNLFQLRNSARAIVRFGTDGRWYVRMDDITTGEIWWDDVPDTPTFVGIVVGTLRHELTFKLYEARAAIELLRLHPEDPVKFRAAWAAQNPVAPESFAHETQAASAPGNQEPPP